VKAVYGGKDLRGYEHVRYKRTWSTILPKDGTSKENVTLVKSVSPKYRDFFLMRFRKTFTRQNTRDMCLEDDTSNDERDSSNWTAACSWLWCTAITQLCPAWRKRVALWWSRWLYWHVRKTENTDKRKEIII